VEESCFDSKVKKREKASLHRIINTGCRDEQDSYPMGTKCLFHWQ